MESELRRIARGLLTTKQVGVVIGYGAGTLEGRVTPVFVTDPDDCDRLVWNRRCYHNLTRFLRKPEVKALGKPALVLKGCDVRSLLGLIAESQLKRQDVVVIGMACDGVASPHPVGGAPGFMPKCVGCEVMVPTAHDHLVGVAANLKQPSGPSTDELVARLDAMTPEQRWAFWMAEFDRCIKCYACREVCPHCFCTQCIAEKSMPQWLSVTSSPSGNFAWNLIRAFHLAGRCGGCMECARTCPVGIPLGLLNRKLVVEVEKAFGFKIGADPEARPPLTTYKTDDNQDFIR